MKKVLILTGHNSPETAHVVADYPYGYVLRCKIRYWLEYKPGKGVRFWSQTTNPKKAGEIWNKPKASTYCKFGGCMVMDLENGHVNWTGLTEYSDGAEAKAWSDQWRAGCPEGALPELDAWVAAKLAYDAARALEPEAAAKDLTIGLAESREAWMDSAIASIKEKKPVTPQVEACWRRLGLAGSMTLPGMTPLGFKKEG